MATDFSQTSENPLRHAIRIARLYEARFYLLHVVPSVRFAVTEADATNAATETAGRIAQQLENQLVECGALAGLRYEFFVRQGDVSAKAEKVISEKQIDLLIIGTHGRRGFGKVLFGSVAEQIFRHAVCPVVTVGPGSFQSAMVDKADVVWPLLFATDFGTASLRALPYCASLANRLGTKLVLLNVIPLSVMSLHRANTHNLKQNSLRRLRNLTQNVELTVEPEFIVVFGSPSEKILQVAESLSADAIIMGLRRSERSEASSHMLWTTAYEVVRRAGCPVMTVRS
jgi:nucleotide-binding universal stress UspA family protein